MSEPRQVPDYPNLRRTTEKPECMISLERFLLNECKRDTVQQIYEATPPFKLLYRGRKP
jgi:hypothetical protein